MEFSIGICAHNEEKNIAGLLSLLLEERPGNAVMNEIIVVSSGSTDKTDSIVGEFSKKDKRVLLVKEQKKTGKANAINRFLSKAKGDILVLVSADALPEKGALGKILEQFEDKSVGAACGKIVPLNDRNTFMGFTGHLIYRLHHLVSLQQPKCGELIAFRNVVKKIPPDVGADEAYIEYAVISKGYSISYVPGAVIHNMAPKSVSEFLEQRRRIFAAHCHLRFAYSYSVRTMGAFRIISLLPKTGVKGPKELVFLLGAVFLESLARILGAFDYYILGRTHSNWKTLKTIKNLEA